MPKFEFEYNLDLTEVLETMGMTDALSPDLADFSKMGNGDQIHINSIIHKTYIEVGEKGTRAGAATSVGMNGGSALPEEKYEVYLNRPFIYMLIDTQNNTPFFIGTVMEIA